MHNDKEKASGRAGEQPTGKTPGLNLWSALQTRRRTLPLGPAHSPAAWQWITRILAISANLTLEGFFLISLRNSPRATSHLQRGRAAGQRSVALDGEEVTETSLLPAHVERMLVARQACLRAGAGPGRTRLTSSPCSKAETAPSCEDGGDGCPEPPHYSPNSHTGSVEIEVCLGWGARRGAGGADYTQSFQCLFLDTWTLGNKEAGRIQESLAAGQTQASLTAYLCPPKQLQLLSPSARSQDPLTSLRTPSHSCASKCLCLETSNGSEEQARNACFSSPCRRHWVGALPG